MARADGGPRHGVRPAPPTPPPASVEIRRRTGFVGDDKGLYDAMTVGGMIRFTASFYPQWSRELEEQYLRRFELPPERAVKALSRGMRTKLALLLALCRGADLLVLDEPDDRARPGGHRRGAAGARRPRGRPRHHGVLLVAPARRRRADCRPRGDHRPRPGRGGWGARRSAAAVPAHPAGVRRRGAGRTRSRRKASSACAAPGGC